MVMSNLWPIFAVEWFPLIITINIYVWIYSLQCRNFIRKLPSPITCDCNEVTGSHLRHTASSWPKTILLPCTAFCISLMIIMGLFSITWYNKQSRSYNISCLITGLSWHQTSKWSLVNYNWKNYQSIWSKTNILCLEFETSFFAQTFPDLRNYIENSKFRLSHDT